METNARVRIASMTKTFAAVMILKLAAGRTICREPRSTLNGHTFLIRI